MLADDPPLPGDGICIGKAGWHAGVIGIVAARLVDRYGVPAMVVALNGDQGRGSARTPAGMHLRDVLADCESTSSPSEATRAQRAARSPSPASRPSRRPSGRP